MFWGQLPFPPKNTPIYLKHDVSSEKVRGGVTSSIPPSIQNIVSDFTSSSRQPLQYVAAATTNAVGIALLLPSTLLPLLFPSPSPFLLLLLLLFD
jgi:hypothetical protein